MSSLALKHKPQASLMLTTNQFRITLPETLCIFTYSLSFVPMISSDNSKLKKILVNKSRNELSRYLGRFIHCGEVILSTKDLLAGMSENSDETEESLGTDALRFNAEFDGTGYEGTILPAGKLEISQSGSFDQRALQVLNISLRNKLKLLRYVQLGSFRNHYNSSSSIPLQNFPAEIWPGYFTSINNFKGGLMLTIDTSFKLVRTDSVLESINTFLKKFGSNSHNKIKSELKNKFIMAFYGSQIMYRIDDILFDEKPTDQFPDQSKARNYIEYYEKTYQTRIKFPKQPLILARKNLKDSPVKLIPELCRMTGAESISDNSMKLKKEVSRITSLRPQEKLNQISELAFQLQSTTDPQWQMINSATPVSVPCIQLAYPSIQTSGKTHSINEKSTFNIQKFTPIKGEKLLRWQLFCYENFQKLIPDLLQGLKSASQSLNQELSKPLEVIIPQSTTLSSLSEFILSKAKQGAQLIVLVMSKNSPAYKITKSALTSSFPVPSQVVTDQSILKNDFSIYHKIYLQILCKIGGIPYTVSLPALPPYTMIVGIDVCHNTFNGKQSVLGFWASLNSTFSVGFSKAAFHGVNQEISDILTPIFIESIEKFTEANSGHKPRLILLYRDGVGNSQYAKVVNIEIPQIVAAIRQVDLNWKPEIVVVGVNKRVNQRFLLNGRNPGHGVLVDDIVVLDNWNFYLISHWTSIGTATPTHYHVVVNESKMATRCLYELTYALCYNYFNWQGGIRVPAPCMYAHKIAYLVGKHTGIEIHRELERSLHFL